MSQGQFAPGDNLLLIDERSREFLVTVPEPDRPITMKGEPLAGELFVDLHDGQLLITPQRRRYLCFRPTMGEVVMNMPRAAQVLYPKDLAMLLTWGDVAPGQNIIEVGTGHGAFTMTLLRALGSKGRLTSYDVRLDHLNRTRKNIAKYLGEEFLENWEPRKLDPGEEGCGLTNQDRFFTDVPEPWLLIDAAADALRHGGIWAAYIPSVTQLAKLIDAINEHREFAHASSFETLQRFWHVRPPSVRPAHFMKAHTGFIITARRRWHWPKGEIPGK